MICIWLREGVPEFGLLGRRGGVAVVLSVRREAWDKTRLP